MQRNEETSIKQAQLVWKLLRHTTTFIHQWLYSVLYAIMITLLLSSLNRMKNCILGRVVTCHDSSHQFSKQKSWAILSWFFSYRKSTVTQVTDSTRVTLKVANDSTRLQNWVTCYISAVVTSNLICVVKLLALKILFEK